MSGGASVKVEHQRGWCGPERSDYTAFDVHSRAAALTERGPQAPTTLRERLRVSPDLESDRQIALIPYQDLGYAVCSLERSSVRLCSRVPQV
jgi:hypothetical protein